MAQVFDELEYEILTSEKIDKNTVHVKTKITAVDMKPVLKEFFVAYIQYAFANALADSQPTEEEVEAKAKEIFLESLENHGDVIVTNEVNIKVVREGKEWKVQPDEAFVEALFGEIIKATEEIQESLSAE